MGTARNIDGSTIRPNAAHVKTRPTDLASAAQTDAWERALLDGLKAMAGIVRGMATTQRRLSTAIERLNLKESIDDEMAAIARDEQVTDGQRG
jgi:hypothetical protein